jgi:thymidylate synthase (FAD)
MTRPIKAADLLALDPRLETVMLQCYPVPEQVIYQAARNDYSEIPIHHQTIPDANKCGEWVVESLLNNERHHWGPAEHAQITLSVAGYVHSVMVQARTHRIATFDCQSQRYTGKRVLKVANGELDVEDVFYVRPVGFYTNRQGRKYDWTEEHRQRKLKRIVEDCMEYSDYYEQGMCEEHLRDYLPQAIRQNFVVSFNLRSVLHFMDLRAKMDAQLEIQALCEQIAPILENWAPNVWAYYAEKRLHKARLAP